MDTTNKGLVRRKHPEANAYEWADGWVIYSKQSGGVSLSQGRHSNARTAWQEALQNVVGTTASGGTDHG